MKVIRNQVFETNSSTSHSIVILSEEDSKRWEENQDLYTCTNFYYWFWEDKPIKPERCKLYTHDELIKIFGEFDPNYYKNEEEFFKDEGFVNYDSWENMELEEDTENFVTPSGDKMVVYCKYGMEY